MSVAWADVKLAAELDPLRGRLVLAEPEEGARDGVSLGYPLEFRRETVELARSSDRARCEVARSLGLSDSTSTNWVNADREARARAADPDGLTESERDELTRLRRENAELKLDREIQRKAAPFPAGDDA